MIPEARADEAAVELIERLRPRRPPEGLAELAGPPPCPPGKAQQQLLIDVLTPVVAVVLEARATGEVLRPGHAEADAGDAGGDRRAEGLTEVGPGTHDHEPRLQRPRRREGRDDREAFPLQRAPQLGAVHRVVDDHGGGAVDGDSPVDAGRHDRGVAGG